MVDRAMMFEQLTFKQVVEEWRTSATRHKVGIIVLALVVIGLSAGKLFMPAKPLMPFPSIGHPYIPAKVDAEVDLDRKPFPAEESL